MTSTPVPARRKRSRGPLTRERLIGLVWQIVVVGLAVAVVAWLWSNAIHNLSVRRISTGFAFLGREAGMPIVDTWLPYSPKDTYLRAFLVGIDYVDQNIGLPLQWLVILACLAAAAFVKSSSSRKLCK